MKLEMTPDYTGAAIAAMQMLIDHNVTETPVQPLPLLMKQPGVRVISFNMMANKADIERKDLVPMFASNTDAATFMLKEQIDDVKYVVVYNAMLPYEIICRAIARELGHIVLGHDGKTRLPQHRRAEAMTFAHHLLSPRPVIHMLQEAIPLTMNVLSDTTGCNAECVFDMQEIPGVHVPPEMNRQVRQQFETGISEYIRFHSSAAYRDNSPPVDLNLFMNWYEE